MSKETGETKMHDERYAEACEIVQRTGKTNISHLQREMFLGYNRAARFLAAMESDGILSPANNRGERKLLVPNAESSGALKR